MRNKELSKGPEWINLVLGAVLACTSTMNAGSQLAAWNAAVTGGLIICFSAIALYRNQSSAARYNLILGSWAVVAPLPLGFGAIATPMWLHVGLGLSVAVIAATQVVSSRSARPAPFK